MAIFSKNRGLNGSHHLEDSFSNRKWALQTG